MTVIETLIRERNGVVWEIFHSLTCREYEGIRDEREKEEARVRNQYELRQEEIDLWNVRVRQK